jgi:hypothetical protein
MSAFKPSAVSFGTPDMPPPDVGSSIGPISLHNAIVDVFCEVRKGTCTYHLTRLSPSYASCVVAGAGAGPRQAFQSKTTNPIATALATMA